METYFVRIGSLAEVHSARAAMSVSRGRRVIVRTMRGVELGCVVGPSRGPSRAAPTAASNQIIRVTSDEDELLIRRLDRHKREAVESCREALAQSGSTSLLLDVDQLFDGGTLLMHFLGPVDEIAESITARVVERYESIVRSRHFAKLLNVGCGPGCGSEQSGGCGDACGSCAVAGACTSK